MPHACSVNLSCTVTYGRLQQKVNVCDCKLWTEYCYYKSAFSVITVSNNLLRGNYVLIEVIMHIVLHTVQPITGTAQM